VHDPTTAAIVIGTEASEPETYAAERLQTLVERRFDVTLPVRTEGSVPGEVEPVFLLGQRSTNAWLDRACTENNIALSESLPGQDGFVIEVLEEDGRQVVLIGGSNARGVIYGQDVFFDLLRDDDGRITFPTASIRDWPSIKWRGRPWRQLWVQVEPGAMDAYVRARMNFVNATTRFPECWKGETAEFSEETEATIRELLAESHRRGIFVYGVISCAVKKEHHSLTLRRFEKLIELGVDGLWISFDDAGAGEDPEGLIRAVLELGEEHGIRGRAVAVTPPGASYLRVDTEFNRRAAAVSGFDAATWFFTMVPHAAQARAAKRIGLRRFPSAWHNWPRIRGGFLHQGYAGFSLREENKPAYQELIDLHRRRGDFYGRHRDASEHTDAIMMWGLGQAEYVTGVLGIWAWSPATHDWRGTKHEIYRWVFGPSCVTVAEEFDERLVNLEYLFDVPGKGTSGTWPCRLRDPSKRPEALRRLRDMDRLLERIEDRAPRESMLASARLHDYFLEPMRATVEYGQKMARADYPEYHERGWKKRIGDLMETGRVEAAEKELQDVQGAVTAQLAEIAENLDGLQGITQAYDALGRTRSAYVSVWEKRISNMDYWK
jgi:hypothetical protein